jgi:hypothetical protein
MNQKPPVSQALRPTTRRKQFPRTAQFFAPPVNFTRARAAA